MSADCPSAAHGTPQDPYGCWERDRQAAARITRAVQQAERARRAPAAVFVHAMRISGAAPDVLTLHDTYEGAVASLLREGGRLYKDRFGYVPRELSPTSADVLRDFGPMLVATRVEQAEDRLRGGGWTACIAELPLEVSRERVLT